MTDDKLQKIIEELEDQIFKDNATFGIFQDGGGSDESFIRADKQGPTLFALELLKAVHKTTDVLSDKERNTIPIPFQESWIDEQSDTVIQFVELVAGRLKRIENKKYKETIGDKIIGFGCYGVLIILAVAVLVGLRTLIKWIF